MERLRENGSLRQTGELGGTDFIFHDLKSRWIIPGELWGVSLPQMLLVVSDDPGHGSFNRVLSGNVKNLRKTRCVGR